jgi:Flp pilus assembly protein TadD
VVKVELGGRDLAAAIQLCRDRIKVAPGDADPYRHLGQLLAAGGDILPAYRNAQRACELAPDDARCWSDRARIYTLGGKLDDAARCFTETRRNPTDGDEVLVAIACWVTARLRSSPPLVAVRA